MDPEDRDLTRRRFLWNLLGAGAGVALAGCGQARRREHHPARPLQRPHHVVQICLLGGFDTLLTVQAKDQSKAGAGIDCEYRWDERLVGRQRSYGPLMGDLFRHEADLALVHGVRSNTVAHGEGTEMLDRGHHNYSPTTPFAADVIGNALPGDAPIPSMMLNAFDASPRFFPFPIGGSLGPGEGGFEWATAPGPGDFQGVTIDAMTPRRLLADRNCPSYALPSWYGALERERLRDTEAFLANDPAELLRARTEIERSRHVQRLLQGADRQTQMKGKILGPTLQLALSAIRNDLVKYTLVRIPSLWLDSHTENLNLQRKRLLPLFADIAVFLDALKQQRNQHGSLFEQTTVVICSELGRYPKLNLAQGKDHWPENSWILAGKGIRPGSTLGATDERFRGMPVDFVTGSTESGNRRPLFMDSIFSTVLHAAGRDPKLFGYADHPPLEYLCTRA